MVDLAIVVAVHQQLHLDDVRPIKAVSGVRRVAGVAVFVSDLHCKAGHILIAIAAAERAARVRGERAVRALDNAETIDILPVGEFIRVFQVFAVLLECVARQQEAAIRVRRFIVIIKAIVEELVNSAAVQAERALLAIAPATELQLVNGSCCARRTDEDAAFVIHAHILDVRARPLAQVQRAVEGDGDRNFQITRADDLQRGGIVFILAGVRNVFLTDGDGERFRRDRMPVQVEREHFAGGAVAVDVRAAGRGIRQQRDGRAGFGGLQRCFEVRIIGRRAVLFAPGDHRHFASGALERIVRFLMHIAMLAGVAANGADTVFQGVRCARFTGGTIVLILIEGFPSVLRVLHDGDIYAARLITEKPVEFIASIFQSGVAVHVAVRKCVAVFQNIAQSGIVLRFVCITAAPEVDAVVQRVLIRPVARPEKSLRQEFRQLCIFQ